MTADGQVRLLDFGTSRLVENEDAQVTTVIATPAYASPEQLCSSGPLTTACDVYSLGAILYELLSGQRAFPASSVAMAVSRVACEQEPPALSSAATEAAAETRGVSVRRLRQAILEVQANVLAFRAKDMDSIPLYRESVADSSQCAGADSDITLRTESLLARSVIVSGQREQGITLLETILPTWRTIPAANPAISIALTYLARAYLETGQPEKAEAAAREGLAVQVGKVNPLSTRVALCRLYLAEALYAEKRPREALVEAELTDQTLCADSGNAGNRAVVCGAGAQLSA